MMANQRSSTYLSEQHLKDLYSSGLNLQQVKATGHFSADKSMAKKHLGFALSGLIFSYTDLDGKPYKTSDGKPFYRIKPDWDNKEKEHPKYLSPSKQGCRPYFSKAFFEWEKVIGSSTTDLWETEGEKKGDCGCANGLAVIAFAGVDAWVDRFDRASGKELESSRPLPELDVITWSHRRVNRCFDSDIIEKPSVQRALAKRAYHLQKVGAYPYFIHLPNEMDGSKNGLDDFIVRHGAEALKKLAESSEPTKVKKDKEGNIYLDLQEPNILLKAVTAWSVLKEHWAFRPGIGWYEYDTTHWRPRTKDEFEAFLTQFMDKQLWKKRDTGTINAVIRELKSRLLIDEKQWDPRDKLAFLNGTLNVSTGKFAEVHVPSDRLIKVRPYQFLQIEVEPDWLALCPNWLKFLKQATNNDQEIIALLRAWIKYLTIPRSKNDKSLIEKSLDLFGPKGTGKGTVLDVLIALVGSENIGPATPETFKSAVGLGQLIDKDIALDTDCTGFLENVGAYNKVVSNEPIEVKKLYRDSYITRLGVAVVRAYNAFIDVPDGSEGLDRRLTVVPFKHRPKVVDLELSKKLRSELSSIFAWAWQLPTREMKHCMLQAGSISAVAETSIERFEANNLEYQFLRQVFPDGKVAVQAGHLYSSYRDWCDRNGQKAKSQRKFGPSIQNLGCQRSHKTNGCYFYDIPEMKSFDVAQHLGIKIDYEGKSGQLEDNERDSVIHDLESHRDDCRPSQSQISHVSESHQLNIGEDYCAVPFPKLPKCCKEKDTAYPEGSSIDCQEQSIVPTPFKAENWQPAVNDLVWYYQNDSRLLVRVLSVPNQDEDPQKRCHAWTVKLESDREVVVWNLADMMPVKL